MKDRLPIRKSSRLMVVNDEGQLFLFRYHDEHKPPFWSTAGGQLQAGEDYLSAAQRELEEETGFAAAIGPVVGERRDTFPVAGTGPVQWLERYFLVNVGGASEPDRTGWTEEERETIRDWKWWSLDEMRRAERGTFLPESIPDLLARCLSRRSGDGQ